MTRQNRITPEGAIVADPARGMFMGNRGILHDDMGRITAPFRHRNWVCCVLEFKGRERKLMQPGCYTELFFLDEALALAAGHRPCADYNRFREAWAKTTGSKPSAKEIDATLHEARVVPRLRVQRTHEADLTDLPDGTFIRGARTPALILGDRLLPWSPSGYGASSPRPGSGRVTVLTPAPTVAVLKAGYRPALHPSAS